MLNVLTILLLTDDWNLKGFCFSLILNVVSLRAEGRNPRLIRGADALCGLPASWKMLSTLSGHLKLEKHIKCRGKKVLNTSFSPFGYIIECGLRVRRPKCGDPSSIKKEPCNLGQVT